MNKTAGLSQLLSVLPGVGGGLHGILDPAEGASRLETGVVEGMGGLAGTAAGGLLGLYLLNKMENGEEDPETQLALAGLGASLGSITGSSLGRELVKREAPEQKQPNQQQILLQLLRKESV